MDWGTGEGLLGLADPAERDAAFERGEDHHKLEHWWLRTADAVEDGRRALRGHRR
ncbi:hypothetical protein [Streptomyces fuscichromogenes]|uniref:Uncharacterized protein n=1 Tax=Streptomyces fuscichromogenes TaxID=1324013 RepID=A0A918CWV7_9ACTN|nr:hypothetical protein [Streptomyces fuscichromogenes]GGN41978.1 hypothetical protein GCM10011578_090870 [Streptomyces fuscichromogenes]